MMQAPTLFSKHQSMLRKRASVPPMPDRAEVDALMGKLPPHEEQHPPAVVEIPYDDDDHGPLSSSTAAKAAKARKQQQQQQQPNRVVLVLEPKVVHAILWTVMACFLLVTLWHSSPWSDQEGGWFATRNASDAGDETLAVVASPPASYDGPPPDLVVHGRRARYAAVPPAHRRRFQVEGKGESIITRAFRSRGWSKVDDLKEAHIFYRSKGTSSGYHYTVGQPWQRYSRVPGFYHMESKDGFLAGFREYQLTHPAESLYFLPETYRLSEERDVAKFVETLQVGGGMERPWVLKKVNVNNGDGIEMLGPHSEALKTAIARAKQDDENDYIVQSYICNELTWFHGQKFDLRMYWVVASVDPVIVLYHDGYVRVGAATYNETDFSTTGQHLTNHAYRAEEQSEVTPEYLWKRIREHYDQHREELSAKIKIDPVQHVRNQMKEALGAVVSAFRGVSFGNDPDQEVTVENLFGFYGADFIIDADLDVWFIEVQASPGFGEDYDYRVDMFRNLFRPLVDIVEEIATKQANDARANLLPLQSLGGYEIVYAGDWQYKYPGYQRSSIKKGCPLASRPSLSRRTFTSVRQGGHGRRERS